MQRVFQNRKKGSSFYFYLLCSLIWGVWDSMNEMLRTKQRTLPSVQTVTLRKKQRKPQSKNILKKKKERIIMSSFTSDSNVNHGRDSEARDIICSPPSQPIGWEEYCREACRDPNSLNRLASPLVRVPYAWSGRHEFEAPAGPNFVRYLKVAQVFYTGDPDMTCLAWHRTLFV